MGLSFFVFYGLKNVEVEEVYLEKLHQLVQAEQETRAAVERRNQLLQVCIDRLESLAQAEEKTRQAKVAYTRSVDRIVERCANLVELVKDRERVSKEQADQIRKLLSFIEQFILKDTVLREWSEAFAEEQGEIKYILMLLLSGNQKMKNEAREGLEKKLIEQNQRNLSILKMQSAKHGGDTKAPLELLNLIHDTQAEIDELESE